MAGLDLRHPLGLAAGFDKDAQAATALLRQGFAFVEIGTVTPRPQAGNPRPRLFRLREDQALVNRLGFNNGGLEVVAARLTRRDRTPGVIGANIGMNRDETDPASAYGQALERLYPLADYITLNVSSPNTPGLRTLQSADRLRPLLDTVLGARARLIARGEPPKPILLKVAPDLDETEVEAIAAAVLAFKVDGLIVGNTTVSRPPGLRSPLAAETGGLSGRPLFALSTRLLARFALRLGPAVPLIAAGGVFNGVEAYAKIRAGAAAVQIYTGLIYRGLKIVPEILGALDACLTRDGLDRLADAVGRDAAIFAKEPARKRTSSRPGHSPA